MQDLLISGLVRIRPSVDTLNKNKQKPPKNYKMATVHWDENLSADTRANGKVLRLPGLLCACPTCPALPKTLYSGSVSHTFTNIETSWFKYS